METRFKSSVELPAVPCICKQWFTIIENVIRWVAGWHMLWTVFTSFRTFTRSQDPSKPFRVVPPYFGKLSVTILNLRCSICDPSGSVCLWLTVLNLLNSTFMWCCLFCDTVWF